MVGFVIKFTKIYVFVCITKYLYFCIRIFYHLNLTEHYYDTHIIGILTPSFAFFVRRKPYAEDDGEDTDR